MADLASPQEFIAALEGLKVSTQKGEGGSTRVSIDIRRLPLWNYSAESSRFTFDLHINGELEIYCPPALVPNGNRAYLQGSTRYYWYFGVPDPRGYKPPRNTNVQGGNKVSSRLYSSPVLAVLRRAAYEAGCWKECDDEVLRVSKKLWRDVWKAIGPELDPRALRLASSFNHTWRQYRLLASRSDLADFVEAAPGIGPRLRDLPKGLSFNRAIVELLGVSKSNVHPTTNERLRIEYGNDPGFRAWVRSVPWSDKLIPTSIKRLGSSRRKQVDDPAWELMIQVARLVDIGGVDPNLIRKLNTDEEWLLFHTAVSDLPRMEIINGILHNPAAAVRSLRRIFPPKLHKKYISEGLTKVSEFLGRGFLVEQYSHQWADKLGDPSLAITDPTKRVKSFARMCREAEKYERKLARTQRLGEFLSYKSELRFLLDAPPSLLRRIVWHPEFPWDGGAINYFLAHSRLRRDPEIRPVLLERAETANQIRSLLGDQYHLETRRLVKRLAEIDRAAAIEYLEQHGFAKEVGWRSDDLAPLFRGGGDLTVRALALVAKLPAPEQNDAGRTKLRQLDLFPSLPSKVITAPKRKR